MKTTGVSGIPKFGLLDFLGHPSPRSSSLATTSFPIQSNCKNSNSHPLQSASFAKKSDGSLHFLTCVQAKNLGSFLQDCLSPAFFTEVQFSWSKVKTLDLSTPSPQDRLAGLVLTAEAVNHIQTSRKSSQAVSPTKLAAILRCSGEVVEKSFPNAGTSIKTWADRLRTLSQSEVPPVSSPTRCQPGDLSSLGHPMPHFHLSS
jgi:hypothetical protein